MLKTVDQIKGLEGETVFLRTDFNVPVNHGVISDNNRIIESLPTIRYLIDKKAKIIIGSHFGRPDGQKTQETSLSSIQKELKKLLGSDVLLSPEVIGTKSSQLAKDLQPGQILLLENLRWDKGEEAGDKKFAQQLASLGGAIVFVNDAFGVSHRPHASVCTIADFLPAYAGMLMEKEIDNLSKLVKNPKKPFVVILGGAKIIDKIGMIDFLAPKADQFLIGGKMANTFMAARGINISESLYEKDVLDKARKYLDKYMDKIVLPIDQVSEKTATGFKIFDIGEGTLREFSKVITRAGTIFWNGCLGYTEDERYRNGTDRVAKYISETKNCFSVLAGGDTVGEVVRAGYKGKFSFVSTGGGAALEFLSGKSLPGVAVLGTND